MHIRQYETGDGACPFAVWFEALEAPAAAKVTTGFTRLGLGNTSNVKGVGSDVFEPKIDFGPGFRVYFGKDGQDGQDIAILVGGGSKNKQPRDIKAALECWQDYKRRKKGKV